MWLLPQISNFQTRTKDEYFEHFVWNCPQVNATRPDKSTLVQVMAWCRQATSHYLSQCWPRSLSPYGVTRPQMSWYIEAETKWPSFCRWPFQMYFLQWKYQNFNWNFTEICSQVSNWWYASIGSDNGLALMQRQAIIWTNDDLVYWHMYASPGLNALTLGGGCDPHVKDKIVSRLSYL